MRDIPILVLLSFPPPNYVDPDTQGTSLIVVNGVFAGLVFTCVVLRLYTRIFLKRWMGSDDYAIIFAAIFTLGLNAAVILANARYYWDRHIWDIPLQQIHHVGKIAIAAKALFVTAAFFTRLSLLCFYYRLTVDTGLGKYRWTLHGTMVFNLMILLAFLPLSVFQCKPISAYWTFPLQGKCINEGHSTLAAGVVNCVADLLVTLLPIPMIMRLSMPLKQRLGVCVLLGLGIIVTIAGVIRTYYIWKALMDSYDETWYAYPLWICAAVEIDLAVLCACAPTLRPLLISITKPIISSISSMYDKGVSSYASKTHGVLSSNATGPSNTLEGNTAINSTADYELEKIDASIDVQERPDGPKRKWSQSWRKYGAEESEMSTSPKLEIETSQTFEVRHEDRTAVRPSQESYLRLDDSSQDLRNQWLGPRQSSKDKIYAHKHNVSVLNTHGLLDDEPAIQQAGPLSPKTRDFQHTQSTSTDRNMHLSPRKAAAPIAEESFYISGPSNAGDSSDSRSDKSTAWPLRPSTAGSSRPELRNGERRWDIERNPFRDDARGANSMDAQRVAVSPRLSHQTRFGSSPDVWEDIQARKKSLSMERSNSRKGKANGVARML